MLQISNISAVLFDMDGTLVDTEILNEPVIRSVCADYGVECPDYEWVAFHGTSWQDIARFVSSGVAGIPDVDNMAWRLHEKYEHYCAVDPPAAIPGSRDAVRAASALFPTGIVSSSFRSSIDAMVEHLDLGGHITCRAGADEYARPKPAPDGYIHAADLLETEPSECLVFEDSIVGMQAALDAGMKVVGVTYRSNATGRAETLAHGTIRDYHDLESRFFASIRKGR